jgi:hypothetical protein
MPQPQPTATTTTNQVQMRGGIVSLPEAVSAAVSFACSMLSADCLHTQLLSLSVHFYTFSRKPGDDGLVPSGHYNTIQNTPTGVNGCRIHGSRSLMERSP